MKRLIVLATLATLLGPAFGCSLLNNRNVRSCETCEQPARRLLSGIALPKISLPWRRSAEISKQCEGCNEGFAEVGVGSPAIVTDGYASGYVDYDANSVYSVPASINSNATISTSTVTGYAGELLQAPHSPELGTRN